MPNKEFLEEYSLFRKFKIDLPDELQYMPSPPINMQCLICNSMQTFNMTNNYWEFYKFLNADPANTKLRLLYQCQSCRQFERLFFIFIGPNRDYCYKLGQYPEWEIKLEKNLEKILGNHSKTFRKGLVCESQSYGIGAFAYFRRITEEIIDELLDSITELIDPEHKDKYLIALEATKKTRVTQEKIELIKDLLPSILKPNGMNPLGVLHSELSEGLHAETDEKCLENANHIKDILIFLLNQIAVSKETAKNFTASMKALLDKKSIVK